MTTPGSAPPGSITSTRLRWLRGEVASWEAAGLLTPEQGRAILNRYYAEDHPRHTLSIGWLLLILGGAFVGVGLIWLVAANLDHFSPVTRFFLVACLWFAALIGAETLAARQGASRAVVGAIRLFAALAFGALIFQSAQSLQVPAFEPKLVGLWSLGTLLHGYLTRSLSPRVVGLATGVFWWISQPLYDVGSAPAAVIVLGAGAVTALAVAALHRSDETIGRLWRLAGVGLVMVCLFIAAIPGGKPDHWHLSWWAYAELGVAVLLAVTALLRSDRLARAEVTAAAAITAVGFGLTLWDTGADTSRIDGADIGHAVISVAIYCAVAVGAAAVGAIRREPVITGVSLAALVVFTTFQSFAVFAPIFTGAWLFVALGSVFVGTGFLVDRTRRRLEASLTRGAKESGKPGQSGEES